ncbi:MAG: hypothetical protein MZV63_31040 [Marinilabiliales bacterium]|nr:hypothetical protein [Marinilabiliales bacterium]
MVSFTIARESSLSFVSQSIRTALLVITHISVIPCPFIIGIYPVKVVTVIKACYAYLPETILFKEFDILIKDFTTFFFMISAYSLFLKAPN